MKAVVYTRVSTEEQTMGYSLDAQKEKCAKKAQELGASEILYFDDAGVSGEIATRPALLDAISAIQNDKSIKFFICTDPDRLSRQLSNLLILTEQIERRGVKLVFTDFNREATPEGELFYSMRGAIAQFEKAMIARRTQTGKIRKARQGGWTHWPDIYGYDYEGGEVRVNEEEAAVVRLIFKLGAEMGVTAICNRLYELGIPSPRAGKLLWSRTTVRRILQYEPYYTGITYIRKHAAHGVHLNRYIANKDERYRRSIRPREEWVKMEIPIIIDEETFRKAQVRFINARRRNPGSAKFMFLLSGLIRCGHCGKTWHGLSQNRRGKRVMYYVCTMKNPGPRKGSNQPKCDTRFIPIDKIDEPVWEVVRGWILDDGKIREYNEMLHLQQRGDDRSPELEVLKGRHAELLAEEEALLDQLSKSKNARVRDRIGERLESLAEEIEKVQKAIEEIESGRNEVALTVDSGLVSEVRDSFPHPDDMTWEQKVEVVHKLIREVVIRLNEGRIDLTIYPHNTQIH
ncbi:recombinase family protein [Alicyclobacillus mali]|uniref:Recombinase family protein n=1 Tax=Alicyclobacillus mali (ex Roth et al. 2021) TaxID=1123961 RepID=A0ABS0F0N5_9BACL|nr:recombinase family protein [Alicyclobacillus mali (ex Roth et al. 2021)]MBF8376838.1 recombinase family protein [Alicyclobacillus mali (ex Roth et al. 2021)]